jgi:hypothetical protein
MRSGQFGAARRSAISSSIRIPVSVSLTAPSLSPAAAQVLGVQLCPVRLIAIFTFCRLVWEARIVVNYSDFIEAAQPDELRKAIAANAEQIANSGHSHQPGDLSSMRYASYQGHDITVRTTYEIKVDGEPFAVPVTVDNNGRVHYHGLPTRDFASVIDLVKKAIDTFPEDFKKSEQKRGRNDRPHHDEHAHER